MFFRRKNHLRNEYDQTLIQQLDSLKHEWMKHRAFLEKSMDPSEEIKVQTKIAEVKYFFLFKEAKNRAITMKRH